MDRHQISFYQTSWGLLFSFFFCHLTSPSFEQVTQVVLLEHKQMCDTAPDNNSCLPKQTEGRVGDA